MTEQEMQARREVARLIRAGHEMIEEDRHWFVCPAEMNDDDGDTYPACGCALGAFYVALNGVPDTVPYAESGNGFLFDVQQDYPVLQTVIDLPKHLKYQWPLILHIRRDTIGVVVNRLHLYEGWSRLQIAAWLESGDEQGGE